MESLFQGAKIFSLLIFYVFFSSTDSAVLEVKIKYGKNPFENYSSLYALCFSPVIIVRVIVASTLIALVTTLWGERMQSKQ